MFCGKHSNLSNFLNIWANKLKRNPNPVNPALEIEMLFCLGNCEIKRPFSIYVKILLVQSKDHLVVDLTEGNWIWTKCNYYLYKNLTLHLNSTNIVVPKIGWIISFLSSFCIPGIPSILLNLVEAETDNFLIQNLRYKTFSLISMFHVMQFNALMKRFWFRKSGDYHSKGGSSGTHCVSNREITSCLKDF